MAKSLMELYAVKADPGLKFEYTMYNVSEKTKAQIEKSLETHIAYLEVQHPGYIYKNCSYQETPVRNEILFRIQFMKK